MPSISSFLSDLSRRKLDTAASGRDGWRDTLNLRRFVLLKNSITQAETPPSPSPLSPIANIPARPSTSNTLDSEEAWLESVLETLEKSDNEVEVKVGAVDEEFTLFESELDDPFECWISSYDVYTVNGEHAPFPLSSDSFLSSPSVLPSFQPPVSLQFLIDSDCSFHQDYVEPRYPEADLDLPLSDTSSDGDSEDDDDDDDDGPPTPYSGSQPSLREQSVVEPQVYIEPDMYFLYPSELSSPPHFQHC